MTEKKITKDTIKKVDKKPTIHVVEKKPIKHTIEKEVKKESSSKGIILSILLGVFIIMAAMQTFQINSLNDKIQQGNVKIGSSSSSSSYGSSGAGGTGSGSVPSNIAELPQMVGGC